ncbi:MAG: NADH-quinone oxidoreductase, partial [Thermoplasmata archaeon HGW-Thermoplasmata-1]
MKFTAIPLIFKQLFEKPVTNLFPAKYAPKSVHGLVAKVQAGKASLNP